MSDTSENIVILQPVRAEDVGRRGRPRTKVNPADVKRPEDVYVRPDGYAPPHPKPKTIAEEKEEDRLKRLKREKKAREVDEVAGKITGELNEQLLQALVAVGFPAEFLYKNGRPRARIIDSNYTDLANTLCISPQQANWMAHGYVEAQEIPAIKKFIGESKPDGPSYFWLGLGAIGLLSYLNQLRQAMKIMSEIKEKLANIQNMANEDSNTPPQGPVFSEES